MNEGRGDDWLEALGDLLPADPPEPWADADTEAADLTEDQRTFLAGLEDVPPVPRLRGLDDGQAPSDDSEGDPTGPS